MTVRSAKPGAKSAKSGVKQRCGGIFQPDPDVPADPVTGQVFCRCGRAGEAGDAHHTLPVVPLDVHQLRAGESAGAE